MSLRPSSMTTPGLALHVAKRYLDHTLSLLKSTQDAIAEVAGFEACVGDLTVSENNINAAVTNLDNFRATLKDLEKVCPYAHSHCRLTLTSEYVLCYDELKPILNKTQKLRRGHNRR
jgi:hypothetical protein